MTESRQETVAAGVGAPPGGPAAEVRIEAGARRELERSCAALDGHTLSRLNGIRHLALERLAHRTERRHRTFFLPFGGLVTACVLVVAVTLLNPQPTVPESQGVVPPEDIDLLTDADSLELYEDYEFYQWLADNGSSI